MEARISIITLGAANMLATICFILKIVHLMDNLHG
jgi:hypothetical protein